MGKKDVLLDNGKKAQSAMTLYWKRNKQMSKHPKEKVQKQEDQQQVNDKRIMSNFQKWKLHKQKVITKAYTKPSQAQPPKEKVQQAKQQQQQNQLYEKMMQKKKPKIISVPGFKSKGDLTQRLQMQTVGPVDQSTNILKLPSHMQGLTQEQIIQMLRQRKSKQDFKKRQKKQDNDKEEDLILGEELVNLSKKQDIIQQPEQKQKQVKQQPYFKSDILNKIQRQGLSQGLSTTLNHNNQVDPQKQQPILNASPVTKQSPSQQEQPAITNGRFVPRVLKK